MTDWLYMKRDALPITIVFMIMVLGNIALMFVALETRPRDLPIIVSDANGNPVHAPIKNQERVR